jgi:hypothetical protein
MMLALSEVKRIAVEVASAAGPRFGVLSAATTGGGSAYVEVTVMIDDCGDQPRRVVIGADRSAGESNLRHAIATRLGQHRDRGGGSPR